MQTMRLFDAQRKEKSKMGRTGKRSVKRGDVLLADLGAPEYGSEQAGKRPVVVVSNDWVNRHNHVYTVVPLTTQINRLDLPTNVLIPANSEEGVTRDAVALCAQTRSLDAVRILRKKGRLNKDTLERITKASWYR